MAHAPQVLRALVRADEVWLLVVAAGIGVFSGIAVWLINGAAQLVHQVLFGIAPDQRLSAMERLSPILTVIVPCFGGLALGLITLAISRVYTRRSVDPIEANALFGGRMSLTGSLVVVLQTIISNGVGASIGLEAAYTQIGSAIASKVGHAFRVRRNDLRLLDELGRDYEKVKANWGGYSAYDAWFAHGANNARLNSVATYYDLVPAFERLLQANGGDLERFYTAAKKLAKLPKAERKRRLTRTFIRNDSVGGSRSAAFTPPQRWN